MKELLNLACLGAQWVKPLLNRPQCLLPDELTRVLADPGSKPAQEGVFRRDWTSRHAMRLNSQTGIEGSPVSSLKL